MKTQLSFQWIAPLVVSYGMGVDSTALLVGLAARGIRPDAILFADTGAERPETYAYLAPFNRWLEEHRPGLFRTHLKVAA